MNILIENLSHYYNEKLALDDVSLIVESTERIGITGPSGGGKSTLLKLISGLYAVQAGVVSYSGVRAEAERRRLTAMVMQSAQLFPASIRDNITCGHDMDGDVVYRACEAAQLTDWISSLPDGLDAYVGERGGKVSGGQAQRIAIARAIAKDAPVILLDEPTSALDGDTRTAVLTALARLTEGKTVVHVSHNPEALMDCNRVFYLDRDQLYSI